MSDLRVDVMSGRPTVVTEEHCRMPWGGGRNGKWFRCYMCGHKLVPGDIVRWVLVRGGKASNLIVCESCDGEDVIDRWVAMTKEARERFWFFTRGEF